MSTIYIVGIVCSVLIIGGAWGAGELFERRRRRKLKVARAPVVEKAREESKEMSRLGAEVRYGTFCLESRSALANRT